MRGVHGAPSACTSNDEEQAQGVQVGINHLFDGLWACKIGDRRFPEEDKLGIYLSRSISFQLPTLVRMRTLLALLTLVLFTACTKEQPDPIPTPAPQDGPRLIMKFKL